MKGGFALTEHEKKIKVLTDVMNPEIKPEKVPLYLNLQGYIVYRTAGYGYTEAIFDSEKILDSYEKMTNMFPADLYYDTGGFASMFFSRCLGSEDFYLSEEKYSLNFKDISYLKGRDEYQKLAENPEEYLWNEFFLKKFKNLSTEKRKNTIFEYLKYTDEHYGRVAEVKSRIENENGTVFLSDVPMYQPAFDYLFQYIVGMRGVSLDMRRNKAELLAAVDSFEKLFSGYMDKFSPILQKDGNPFQGQICLLGQTITNRQQFSEFIWPYLSAQIDKYVEKNAKFYFMVEGGTGPLIDYLDRIPDGMCALHVEKDSLDDLIQRFGKKFTYVGGMPVEILGTATTDECKKYTLDVLEKYGHDGNFIFTTDKGVVFEHDATVENLKVVCDTVNSFKP